MRPPRRTGSPSAYVLVHTVDALVHNFILHPPKGIGVGELTDELVRMLRGHLELSATS